MAGSKKQKWVAFDVAKGFRQKRPPIKKWVLVAYEPDPARGYEAPCVVAGYRKDAAGDKSCPYFVTPSANFERPPGNGLPMRRVVAWCDCLPDGFEFPVHLVVKMEVR